MEEGAIIGLLFDRTEQAIEELQKKYSRLILNISNNMLNNIESAKECENDTYLAVWNTIPPKKPESLTNYVCKIAKNLSLVKYRNEHTKKRMANIVAFDELEEMLSGASVEDEVLVGELSEAVNRFLDEIDVENRKIWMAYYWLAMPITKIAAKSGITAGTARTRLSRMRTSLKEMLVKEGLIDEK